MTDTPRKPSGVDRRAVLRGLATGLAGAAALPATGALAHAAATTPASPDAARHQADSQAPFPTLFSDAEMATLESLSELLVPGSVAAGVPALMDRVVAVDSENGQRNMLDTLRAFEAVARREHASRWIDLDRDTQIAILQQASDGTRPALQRSMVQLRDRVADTYFATEAGMQRRGWTGRTAWRELPVCEHTGGDHR